MRIFAAALATETNTFLPIPTSAENFHEGTYFPPGKNPGWPTMYSAPLVVARRRVREEGWTLIEGSCAWAEPAGLCARATYEGFRDEILGQLQAAAPVDGVLFGLHGTMVAHGSDDCEGDLIARAEQTAQSEAGQGSALGRNHSGAQKLPALKVSYGFRSIGTGEGTGWRPDETGAIRHLGMFRARNRAGRCPCRPH